jgi:hypothetical protein
MVKELRNLELKWARYKLSKFIGLNANGNRHGNYLYNFY